MNAIDHYYWYEDTEKPMDVNNFKPVESVCSETVDFDGQSYYVVEGGMDDDEIVAVPSDAEPDCNGCYKTVILVVEDGGVVDENSNDQYFNSTEGELE